MRSYIGAKTRLFLCRPTARVYHYGRLSSTPIADAAYRTQAFLIDHQPVVELVVMLGLYMRVWGASFRVSAIDEEGQGRRLSVHVPCHPHSCQLYHRRSLLRPPAIQRAHTGPARPGLGLVQAVSSLYLAKHYFRNDTLYKAGFQTMGVLNLASVITVCVTGSPQWHRVLVKCLLSSYWFTYFRWLIRAILKYHLLFSGTLKCRTPR